MDPHDDGTKLNPMYTKLPHDFPTWRHLNQPLYLSAEHANLHEVHASSPYLPQLTSLHAPAVSDQSLLMHPHDHVLATKSQIGVLDTEIRSVIHPTFVRQFNEAHGFPSPLLPAGSFRELLLENRSNLDCLQQCTDDAVGLMTGIQHHNHHHHHVDGLRLSKHYGAANQVGGDLNGSMCRGNMNMENRGDQIQRRVGAGLDNDINIAARSLSMMTNSNTAPARLSPTYTNNNTGTSNQGLIDATVEGMGLIKGQTAGINDGNTSAVAHHHHHHEKRFSALRSSSTICFGQAPPLDVDTILEQPVSLNPKRRLSSSIITPFKSAQLECMSYPSAGAMWDNNSGYNGMQAASRPKKSSRHPLGPALNTNLRPRARQGSANDPQSIAARQRRGRINARLKALQELVPNGSKVDLVTMLEKAINYVKFLQLQLKVLTDDEFWRDPQNLVGYNSNGINEKKIDKEEYSSPKSSNGVP